MNDHAVKARRFLELHHGERPLLLPSGTKDRAAAGLVEVPGHHQQRVCRHPGRLDGSVTRDEALVMPPRSCR